MIVLGAEPAGGEPLVVHQLRVVDGGAEQGPLVHGPAHDGHHHVPIASLERLERGRHRVTGPQGLRHLAGGEVSGEGVLHDRHLAVHHPHVDGLSLARALPLVEGRQYADGGEEAGGDVAQAGPRPHGRPARVSGNAEHAPHPLHDHVQGRPLGVGPRLSEAGDGGVDEPGIVAPQHLVPQAQSVHGPRAEVLQHHVRSLGHLNKQLPAPGRRQVQGHAPLAPVDAHEVGAVIAHERPVASGLVSRARLLDLDNVGAQVRQHHGAEGAGQDPAQVQDSHTFQRSGHGDTPQPQNNPWARCV